MIQANQIVRMHDEATQQWHDDASLREHDRPPSDSHQASSKSPFLSLAIEQHRANYHLWHQEDDARDPQASDASIAKVKHQIDRLNQSRNDLVEQIDVLLFASAGSQSASAPLHSETPGLIVDRLSILALKLYHTALESRRESASVAHRARNLARLEVLTQQRADLARCLDELWAEVLAGHRRFKLYRQMKMYNDPNLNPVLYRGSETEKPGD